MTTWDLEYLLLFGPPENKLELLDGRTPCSFPFLDRTVADAHFELWGKQLAQWQGMSDPPPRAENVMRVKEFGLFRLEQHRKPIRLEVPSIWEGYEWAYTSFWERSLWPGQPPGFENGSEWRQDHWDIKQNLWTIFSEECERLGIEGDGLGGVDVCLTERDIVQPDYFFFAGPRKRYLVDGHYFKGVPQLVMEVMSPFSRAIDRGPRKEVYRRAQVPQLWLIDPILKTVELHRLENGEYHLEVKASVGEALPVPGLEGLTVAADRVFNTQSKRFGDVHKTSQDAPPSWGIPCDEVVGLQHLILLGHTERRREIWNDQSPCFLAFGSAEEAQHRLNQFLLEAGRWFGTKAPIVTEIEPGIEAADVGTFHFSRRGNVVRLNIDVRGTLYRALLDVNANRDAWTW